jgi:hypothetical protein
MSLQKNAPRGLSLDILPLLLQGKRGLPLALRRLRGLPQADGGSDGQSQADSQSYDPIHLHPLPILNVIRNFFMLDFLFPQCRRANSNTKQRKGARQGLSAAPRLRVEVRG